MEDVSEERVVTSVNAKHGRMPVHHMLGSGVDAQHPTLRPVTETEFENTLAHIAELYVKSMALRDIAQTCHIAVASLHDVYLPALRARWREHADIDFAERVALDLAKLDQLEREYWRGWERSLQKKATQKQSGRVQNKKDLHATEFEATTEELTGDPRFLDGIQKCLERRAKLIGYDAEVKLRVLSPHGEHVHELGQRIAKYEAHFGVRISFDPTDASADVDGHRLAESVDSERTARAAERILDADYTATGDRP